MTSENDLRNDLLKYNAETQRLLKERVQRGMRETRYELDTQWQNEEAFAQFYYDKAKADEFFIERERTERKMLIELLEKQGIPNAAEVADERLSRLAVEARMRTNEIQRAMNTQKQDGALECVDPLTARHRTLQQATPPRGTRMPVTLSTALR